MPEPSPADELRAAAATLREAAVWASDGPWWVEDTSPRAWGEQRDAEVASSKGTLAVLPYDKKGDLNATWITLMDPTVGDALADWLEHASTRHDPAADIQATDRSHEVAAAVARAINAKEQPR